MNQPLASVLIAILSLQVGASLAKQLFPLLGAEGATTLRIFFAAAILVGIFKPWRIRLDAKMRKLIFIYGISIGIMNLLFYKALEHIPQGVTVALEFTGPLGLSILLSRKWTDFLWATLAIAGVLLLLPLSADAKALNLVGVIYALAAGFCWALYIFFGQKVGTTQGQSAIALGMCFACLVTLPFGLAVQGRELFNFSLWPLALGVALLSSVIPYSLELRALNKISAKTFGILMSLEPAAATLTAYIFLHEKITWVQGLAIFFISAASLGSSLTNSAVPSSAATPVN